MSTLIKVNRIIKIGAIAGSLLVIIGLLGAFWADTVHSDSAFGKFAYVLYTGLICLMPLALKLAVTIMKLLWTLFKRMVFEIVYEATRAVECGKKGIKNG